MKTFCQQCHMKCPVVAVVEDGKVQEMKGTKCVKGLNAHRVLYHPDRVRHPLKRTGKRGEGRWQPVSWGEALEAMAERFNAVRTAYGAESIATISGCFHKENAVCATFLFSYLTGTPNVLDANHLCIIPDVISQLVTVGEVIHSDPLVDYKRSRCILIWGANPAETRPPQAHDIFKAKEQGAKLIVVDPRPTRTASRADLWLRVRPGADAALALGMLHVIVNEGLYDRDFVDKWCVGFEDLKGRVQDFSPSRAAEVTWVPEHEIREAARMFATIKPACLHTRLGAGSQHVNATHTSQAITILTALVGCIDVPGGNLLGDRLGGFRRIAAMPRLLRLPAEIAVKRLGAAEFPFTAGADAPFLARAHTPSGVKAMLTKEIRAFYVPGSNFVVNEGNSREVWDALNNLDFLAVADLFMTPTAELADLVLPAAHWLETDTPLDAWKDMGPDLFNYILAAPQVVEPLGECWDDRKIVLELATAMGLESSWPDVDGFNNWRLERVGISFAELHGMPEQVKSFPVGYRKYEKKGFRTPSGKIELRSSIFEKAGYEPLPHHREPPESPLSTPELASRYPLILTTFRSVAYEHTEYRQIDPLRALLREPQLEINPQTAARLGIAEGDAVWIETSRLKHRVTAKARFESQLHPNVVASLFGWWFPEKPAPEHGCFDSNINTIIDNGPPYEPLNGNYQARGILCRVGKAEAERAKSFE